MKSSQKLFYFVTIFLVIVFSGKFLNLLADYFWFQAVGYDPVFLKTLITKFLVWLVFTLLSGGFFFINIYLAHTNTQKHSEMKLRLVTEIPQITMKQRAINTTILLVSVVTGIIMGMLVLPSWFVILRYLNQTPFGTIDPLFGRDIGFYVFSLPVYRTLTSWIFFLLIITLIGLGTIYLRGRLPLENNFPASKPSLPIQAKFHLSILTGLLFFLYAIQVRLDIFDLLYSRQGATFGAGYTDIHAQLWAYWLILIFAVITGAVFLISSRSPKWKAPLISIGVLVSGMIMAGHIYPQIMQRFVVEPNELEKERPYIKNSIHYTRKAYNLDKIEEKNFAADNSLTITDIEGETPTIRNIKLWDKRPLKLTYKEIQEMRLYYNFQSVDVDRYMVDGRLVQVMLSPREMVPGLLPPEAQTWENTHLKYTHGYGLGMSPVNHVTPEGLPHLIIKDIPPVSETSLVVEQPEIYYGEESVAYVIVNTASPEFDYPKGDKNVYAKYEGIGGIKLTSWFKRLLFAWEEADLQIFFSDYISNESRILLRRNVVDRVRAVAPYIDFDQDPYLVLSEGRLYWILDGYTISDRYPYSEPFAENLNYIRNPIKAVVDAYNGSIYLYLVDPTDSLIQTFNKIFPGVLKPFDQMSEDLRKHIRYPKDLFEIQCRMYQTYHMKDTTVFYNREDQWETPREIDEEQPMRPYYLIMRLPGEKHEEFLLFLPFTPQNKSNMIAWIGARCDGDRYGKLIVYKFPKEKLIYGPKQIEARINQNTEISKELTLWGQQGSQVIQGDLLVIPIKQSLLYVKPLYLQASKNQIPELKRIIIAFGNQIVMKENLYSALAGIFGGKDKLETVIGIPPHPSTTDERIRELAIKAYERFAVAEELLKESRWTEWGKVMEEVKDLLKKIRDQSIKKQPGAIGESL